MNTERLPYLDKDNSKEQIYPPFCYTIAVRFATFLRQHLDDAGTMNTKGVFYLFFQP